MRGMENVNFGEDFLVKYYPDYIQGMCGSV